MTLMHFQRGGFKPIILFGGATGLIGDPSGRSTERQQLSREEVENNIRMFRSNFEDVLKNVYSEKHARKYFSHLNKTPDELINEIKFVNNIDFYDKMSIIDFIRDVGIHFRVNTLLSRDSVKSRLALDSDGK